MNAPFLQPDHLTVLFLVFARVTGVLIAAPIFQTQRLPVLLRVGLGALLSALLLPLAGAPTVSEDMFPFLLSLAQEFIVGLSFGMVSNLIFAAVSIAGEMADLQSGLAFSALVDPMSEERSALIGQFQTLVAWLVFLVTNGHHVLLRGLGQSFSVLPLGTAALPTGSFEGPVTLVSRTFAVALQIGAPAIGATLIADLSLGMLARAVPQMNLLVIGLPVKMLFALVVLLLSLPFLLAAERGLVPLMDQSVHEFLTYLGGGR